jgi:hypothetical protein
MIDSLQVGSGFVVGFLVGITGVGGGSLMTPLLILLFGVHPATAVGTDLLYAASTKTGRRSMLRPARSIGLSFVYWPLAACRRRSSLSLCFLNSICIAPRPNTSLLLRSERS